VVKIFFALSIVLFGGTEVTEFERKVAFELYFPDTDSSRENVTNLTIVSLIQCTKTEKYKRHNASNYLVGTEKNYYCLPDEFEGDMVGKFGDAKFANYYLRAK
jgi:hypothetical protein